MSGLIEFGVRKIGSGQPAFLIAEAGINHNGDISLALDMVDAAAACGADAIKFQTFTAAAFITRSNPYFGLFTSCELSRADFEKIAKRAIDRNLTFFSTPLDEAAVDLLESLSVSGYKVASCDVTHLPLLRYIAAKRKTVLLSTGTATLGETLTAVDTLQAAGAGGIGVFHCVSKYPAAPEDVNLRVIPKLAHILRRPVGFSDHTLGIDVPVAAVAVGGAMIEKHFTLDKKLKGPDHELSADPDEFRRMAASIRVVEKSLGLKEKVPVEGQEMIGVLRRSLVANQSIPAGTVITRTMIAAKRPGTGIAPAFLDAVIGRKAARDLSEDTLLSWEHFA
jgi:N,N'-diacetyllegionaminate synthase